VTIKLRCEHCGASIQAPRDKAGKTSKCPACGNSIYVPTPENELEELPLAPEDASELQNEAMLQEERRKLDGLLAREEGPSEGVETQDGSSGHRGSPAPGTGPRGAGRLGGGDQPAAMGPTRSEKAVTAYLTAMRDSDFDAAERAVSALRLQPRVAKELIDRLAADQIPPPEMANVPPGVYQGFLKSLRSRLG